MKISKTFQRLLSLAFTLCCLAACEKKDESLSSVKEATLEGEASRLEITIHSNDWLIASVSDIKGQHINDKDNNPMRLENLGSMHFRWGVISRNKPNAITIELDDNFDQADRAFMLNLELKTGLYKEQITIRQKQCLNYYLIDSMIYTLEEGDGVKETAARPWRSTYMDPNGDPGETRTITYFLIYLADIDYSFKYKTTEFQQNWLSPKEEDHSVSMPKNIENGEITFEKEKQSYTEKGMYLNRTKGKSQEVEVVSWTKYMHSADVFYKQLQVTYTMNLSRVNSNTRKTVKGKLIKEFPYDYSLIRSQILESGTGD